MNWRDVDRALRAIKYRRGGLDAEEARWLREAEAMQIWKPFGMASVLDYMERVLEYTPRTAQDRLRVARALGALPRLTDALAGGGLAFSAVRELTRVATPGTEGDWLAAAAGKNLRQIEDGTRAGDSSHRASRRWWRARRGPSRAAVLGVSYGAPRGDAGDSRAGR